MIYESVLTVINKVMRKLHVAEVSSLDENKLSLLALDNLNTTVYDICESGDFVDRRKTADFISTNGVISVSAEESINRIEDLYYGTRELINKKPHEIRRRTIQSNSTTTPSEYSITDSSAGTVDITIWGISDDVSVSAAYYLEPPQYSTSSEDAILPYDSGTVFQGTYALMVLDEAGGEATPEFNAHYALYEKRKRNALAKFTTDTGNSLQIRYEL